MFETQGVTRNRTRDLAKKGSAFITSSDHWTIFCLCWMAGWFHGACVGGCFFVFPLCGFSLSLFCNYDHVLPHAHGE